MIQLAEVGDNRALSVDGPVPPTWDMLERGEMQRFFKAAYRLAMIVREGLGDG